MTRKVDRPSPSSSAITLPVHAGVLPAPIPIQEPPETPWRGGRGRFEIQPGRAAAPTHCRARGRVKPCALLLGGVDTQVPFSSDRGANGGGRGRAVPIDDENILGRLERIAETTVDYELYVVAFEAAADPTAGHRPWRAAYGRRHRRLAQRLLNATCVEQIEADRRIVVLNGLVDDRIWVVARMAASQSGAEQCFQGFC